MMKVITNQSIPKGSFGEKCPTYQSTNIEENKRNEGGYQKVFGRHTTILPKNIENWTSEAGSRIVTLI